MNMFQEQISTLICGKECQICMERRHLQQFCDNHSFCHSCCKEWSETSVLCPCCRKKCTNKKYLTYDYTVLNTDYEFFKENYEYHFLLWHSDFCIKKKHKFYVSVFETHLLFYCKDCHIEQIFII